MRLIIIHLMSLVFLAHAWGQEGTFSASVDRSEIAVGEQFELTFTLTGSTSATNFHPPAFNDFLPLSGPNQSTNVQFMNGSVSQSVSLSYVLQSKAEGTFTIGAATVEYNGKILQSQPISMKVVKGAPQARAAKPNQRAEEENPEVGKQISDNLFLKIVADKSHVVQGEQITATYKLYNRVSLVNLSISKLPALTGFWSEDIEDIKQVKFTREILNGKTYNVAVLKKVALFPQRSGTLEIDPLEITCAVQIPTKKRSNNLFDQFFNDPFFGPGASNVNYKVRGERVKISVVPLPSSNVPGGFGGAVGKYSMETWLEKHEVRANEPVTLKVKISGRGNLKLLEAPALKIPPDVEKYDPKISDVVSHQGDQIAGSRTFEYLLIPRHPGEQRIPPYIFSYFDIDKKEYVSIASPEFILSVEKGSEVVAAPNSGISKEDVKLLAEDIHFIKSENVAVERKGEMFAGSTTFYLLSLSPILSFIGLFFAVRRRERMLGDVISLRKRKARKMAQRRLVDARKFLDGKKKEDFYSEISRALWGYIADKLTISPADCSIEVVRDALGSRGVPAEVIMKLTSTIEHSDFARFAPSSDSLQMDGVYREAVELISTIEDHTQ